LSIRVSNRAMNRERARVVGERPTAHVAAISIDLELFLDVIQPGRGRKLRTTHEQRRATASAAGAHSQPDTSLANTLDDC
jgi:hypothetical protein